MILILLLVPLMAIIGFLIYMINPFSEEKCGIFAQIIGYAINLFISFLISMFILIFIDFKETENKIEIKRHNIISLKNGMETHGSFILGSGSIEGVEYYYYFYNTKNGIKRGKTTINNTYIKECDITNGYISDVFYETESRFGIFDKSAVSKQPINTILYVPKNTIIREYKVD